MTTHTARMLVFGFFFLAGAFWEASAWPQMAAALAGAVGACRLLRFEEERLERAAATLVEGLGLRDPQCDWTSYGGQRCVLGAGHDGDHRDEEGQPYAEEEGV